MKTLKLILTASIILFLCASCEKDENGNRIAYYKNKTGEGYVFYKFENDSIAPIANAKTQIESYTRGWFSTVTSHFDYVYTDSNGKFSFKFAKRINEKKVEGYYIDFSPREYNPVHSTGKHFDCNLLDNSDKIFIDTLFFYHDPLIN